MNLIELDQTSFGYNGKAIVRVERLPLQSGKSLGIFGPNGAGKTTLVRGLTGLLSPLSGRVSRREEIRIAYMPQHASMESHWPMSGFDAAAMTMSAQRPMGWVGSSRREILNMMTRLGVANLADRAFFKLSGGQQQRILLAGAMVIQPHLLVLDEPTSGLDVHSRRMLVDVLLDFTQQGLTSVMISHEIEDLTEVCDEVAWLCPAGQADQPTRVELVAPDEMAKRLFVNRSAT
ncbi:MAG TPA: ATP-binding cassette domain-containing protein [Tepidisphaeraceae bacterium]|nr:ATP-binding cassette domain-containing protein [Tepidisphaeraceae bacterium]